MGDTLGRTPGHWDSGKQPIAGIQEARQGLLGKPVGVRGLEAAGNWTPGGMKAAWEESGWEGSCTGPAGEVRHRLRVQETNAFQTSETRRGAGRTRRSVPWVGGVFLRWVSHHSSSLAQPGRAPWWDGTVGMEEARAPSSNHLPLPQTAAWRRGGAAGS